MATEGPLRYTTAGADLSSTGQYLFIYLDSSDSYKAKLLTSPVWNANAVGVLQNAPADDAIAEWRNEGVATVTAGGVIKPWAPVTVSSASKAVQAGANDMVLGYFIPKNTAAGVLAACAATDTIQVLLTKPTSLDATSGIAVGYHDFATDGGAVNTSLSMRNSTALGSTAVVIPTGSTITYAHVFVDTTYASTAGGTDKSVIGLNMGGIVLVTAVAIETSTPWDAGGRNCIQVGTGITCAETTSALPLSLVISVQAFTAGAMRVFVHYSTVPSE